MAEEGTQTPAPAPKPEQKQAPAPKSAPAVSESRSRNMLIVGSLAVFAAIIFGLLYLFVIAPSAPEGSSVGWFLFSFATGLTMIVMPCTLPLAFVIVPLSMGKGLVRGLGMALAFGLGIAVTLSLYGVAAALIGSLAIDALGAPLESVKNWVYFIAGIFALTFALSEIGLMKFRMPSYSGAAPAFIQKRKEIFKAFLLGLFLGNIGVGCPHPATPLILIEIASSGDILYGWLMFLVHAIGRILPLLLLAFLGILGVNGLSWLMTRKDAVERATGWAMVFVAGFILTLGLFTHDWWVNSGIHTVLEKITQESTFNAILNDQLGTNVAHVHGLEDGTGMFGLPLWLGNWFLVAVWLIPIWWWWLRKRKQMYKSPAFRLKSLEEKIDRLEKDRRQVESMISLDEVETEFDLAAHTKQMDDLEKERRAAEEKVQFAEQGTFKEPLARDYETKILKMQRNYFLIISVFLVLTFVYFLPKNFYLASMSGADHHAPGAVTSMPTGVHMMPDGTFMDGSGNVLEGAHMMDGSVMLGDGTTVPPENMAAGMMGMTGGTPFTTDISNLPDAVPPPTITLQNGATYDITASYVKKEVGNRTLRMLAYNRSVPGPFIKVPQGAEITINFTNDTDIDQTIHSHGVRIDNNFDGVPGMTQRSVKPGETFAYTIRFEDAGVYWYHPHTREDYGQELGLYGNYLIEPSETDYWSPVNREVPLVIDDILLDSDRIANFYREFINFALLGRFGNEYLVNGERNFALVAREGEVIRFFITNVSNARTYNLSIPGARLKLVGADIGKYERETLVENILISPAERVVVEAYFEDPGAYSLTHSLPDNDAQLATIVVDNEAAVPSYRNEFLTTRTNIAVVDEFEGFRDYLSTTPHKRLRFSVDLGSAMVDHSQHGHASGAETSGVDHGQHAHTEAAASDDPLASIQWDDPMRSDAMNTTENISWKLIDEVTGLENMNIDWTFKQGDLVKISLFNDPMAEHVMQHPIHFHGQRFVVLARDGVPNENLAWKDTELVLPGETVDLLVEMSNLGEWMAHCHIAEHLHAGMMLGFRVEDQNGYATGDEFRASIPESERMQAHDPSMTGGMGDSATENLTGTTYSFTDALPENNYSVTTDNQFSQAGKRRDISFTIVDRSGTHIALSRDIARPLTVTFVRSDNAVTVHTYPGNTAFDVVAPAPAAPPPPSMPADDGHDHIHMLPFVNTAYAHGGIDDGHAVSSTEGREFVYTTPVVFPTAGNYRAFVEFVPLGGSEVRVTSFNVEVAQPGFSINNFGWDAGEKWWILLIVSLMIMTPLSYGVYRYLKAAEVSSKK